MLHHRSVGGNSSTRHICTACGPARVHALLICEASSHAPSQVDQPLCVECAAKVVAEVDATTRAAEEEAAAYEAALERLQVCRHCHRRLPTMPSAPF
jgi:hypothetical protein